MRVLIVEDQADTREWIAEVLRIHAMKVTSAASVGDAIKMARTADFDLLVTDLGMPGEDGFDLLRRLRTAGQRNATIPAIALTAYASAEDRAKVHAAGFQDHAAKPITPEALVAVVARVLVRAKEQSSGTSAR